MSGEKCEHERFVAGVEVHRQQDDPNGPVTNYMADMQIRSEPYGANFVFVGPPVGISLLTPMVIADRTELRAPTALPPRANLLELS